VLDGVGLMYLAAGVLALAILGRQVERAPVAERVGAVDPV